MAIIMPKVQYNWNEAGGQSGFIIVFCEPVTVMFVDMRLVMLVSVKREWRYEYIFIAIYTSL